MKTNATIHFIGARECPYTLNGRKLTEMRRSELRGIARRIKVNADGTKNELLHRLIARLGAMGVEKELGSG